MMISPLSLDYFLALPWSNIEPTLLPGSSQSYDLVHFSAEISQKEKANGLATLSPPSDLICSSFLLGVQIHCHVNKFSFFVKGGALFELIVAGWAQVNSTDTS